MTVDIHFRFDNFELILFSDNSMPKYSQTRFNTRKKLYFTTIGYDILQLVADGNSQ